MVHCIYKNIHNHMVLHLFCDWYTVFTIMYGRRWSSVPIEGLSCTFSKSVSIVKFQLLNQEDVSAKKFYKTNPQIDC